MDFLKQRPRFSSFLPFAHDNEDYFLLSIQCLQGGHRAPLQGHWDALSSVQQEAVWDLAPPQAGYGCLQLVRTGCHRLTQVSSCTGWVLMICLECSLEHGSEEEWEIGRSWDISKASKALSIWADYKSLQGRNHIFRGSVTSWYKLGHQNSVMCYYLIPSLSFCLIAV